MQIACENCGRRYNVPDDKVRGRQVKVRCKHCQHLTTITGPSASQPEVNPFGDDGGDRTSVANVEQLAQLREQARAPAPAQAPKRPEAKAEWFGMVKGAQVGPFDVAALATKFQSGELNGRSFLWKQGMGDWKRADELAELASALRPPVPAAPPRASAPPPPPAPPPRVASMSQPPRVRIAEPIREEAAFDREFEGARLPLGASETEPEAEPAPAAAQPSLDSLFADLPPSATHRQPSVEDPFAAVVGTLDPSAAPPPGEATSFFMQEAGVNKGQRNPLWKILLFVVLLVGVPLGALYLLSELHVVPLQVSSVNEQGEEVQTSVFSGAGVKGLGDLLLGRNKQPKEEEKTPLAVAPPVKKKEPVAKKEAPRDEEPVRAPDQPSQEELAALYKDERIDSKGPKLKVATEKPALDKAAAGGLGEEEVVKVVGQSQPAFQSCIEMELKKNPRLRVGKIVITATVAPSGAVTRAEVDKREVSTSNLGECLKGRAKRMVFSPFEGEETEVQIPLMVTSSF